MTALNTLLLWLGLAFSANYVLAFLPQHMPLGRRTLTTTSLSSGTIGKELESLSVCIVGAGPSGLLAAHRLAKAGAQVRLIERRPRFTAKPSEGRAYALGIGRRGRNSIKSVDMELWERVRGKGFASERFDLYLPFGLRLRLRDDGDGEEPEEGRVVEPSILLFQNDLCAALMDELETRYGDSSLVQFNFNEPVQKVDLAKQQLFTKSGQIHDFDMILGCDGVNSVVRKAMEEQWDDFEASKEPIPGHYKVVRLNDMPKALDPRAVSLLLPQSGAVTAFVEPTINGSCCILFAGNNASDPLLGSSNDTELLELIESRWPKLQSDGLIQAAQQLVAAAETSTASVVRCNTFSYAHKAVLLGDSAHATGGVSGQGVNSALVDVKVLADKLLQFYNSTESETSLRKALLEYSIQQVPEAKALYDLSFGPKPTSSFKRLAIAFKTLRDSVFKGRFGIGQLPLQTKLTTSLSPFREIRRQKDGDYEEEFPSDNFWRESLTKLDATVKQLDHEPQ